ncbi:hypothetical protein DFH08DRAFT_959131 [Mycena albidolilacea]|uniref:Uncharacterized protein n=1 Tax=Mycena albidolilacea TaxID=1033008 RepID=A0AAD7A3Y2_9AGAR|nr:hypothetical protein DFH08DRAFT_959131 [Mycena albidolilacea]
MQPEIIAKHRISWEHILCGHTRAPGVESTTSISSSRTTTTFFLLREVVQVPLPAGTMRFGTQVSQLAADGKTVHFMGGGQSSVYGAAGHRDAGFHTCIVYTHGGDQFVLRNASVPLTISRAGGLRAPWMCSSGTSPPARFFLRTGLMTCIYFADASSSRSQEGATGGLVIFEDWPNYWDASDAEIHYLEKPAHLDLRRCRSSRKARCISVPGVLLYETKLEGIKFDVVMCSLAYPVVPPQRWPEQMAVEGHVTLEPRDLGDGKLLANIVREHEHYFEEKFWQRSSMPAIVVGVRKTLHRLAL